MSNDELIEKLLRFKDKAWCHYTHYEAHHIWSEIARFIPKQFASSIQTEWCHCYLGHGFRQACMALDTEITKCVEYLSK